MGTRYLGTFAPQLVNSLCARVPADATEGVHLAADCFVRYRSAWDACQLATMLQCAGIEADLVRELDALAAAAVRMGAE
jgi:hypothetical protein